MKVCVFGAGAIGGSLAARFSNSGTEVSVVARGDHLTAIRQNGLTLILPERKVHVHIAASSDPRDLGPQDAVFVTVKAPALPDVAATIAPLLRADTPVVFCMNGVPWWYFYAHGGPFNDRRLPLIDPNDAVWNAVGPQRAIGCVVFYLAADVIRPGVVSAVGGNVRLIVGEPNGKTSTRIQRIAQLIAKSGINVDISSRIRDDIWTKLMANMSGNPLPFLTGATIAEIFAEPLCIDAIRRIAREVIDIAHAVGCKCDIDVETMISDSKNLTIKPSIVRDLDNGRPMELDAIFTVPMEFGKMFGVQTPMLELFVTLMKLRAKAAENQRT